MPLLLVLTRDNLLEWVVGGCGKNPMVATGAGG